MDLPITAVEGSGCLLPKGGGSLPVWGSPGRTGGPISRRIVAGTTNDGRPHERAPAGIPAPRRRLEWREQEAHTDPSGQGLPQGRPGPRMPPGGVCDIVASEALHALLERGLKAIVALAGARGGVIRLVPACRRRHAPGLRRGAAPRHPRQRGPGGQRLRHVRRRPAHGRRPGPGRVVRLRPPHGRLRHRARDGPDAGRSPALPGTHHRRLQPLLRRLGAPAFRHHGAPGPGHRDAGPGPRQRPARAGAAPVLPVGRAPDVRRARSTTRSPRGSRSCACA